VLLTHDVSTMTRHAYDRVRAGKAMPGAVESQTAAGSRRPEDDCIGPEGDPASRSAHVVVEVGGGARPLRLELGEPADFNLEGVYRHDQAVVAAFYGGYSCSYALATGGGEAGAHWSSLAGLEWHREATPLTADAWTSIASGGSTVVVAGHDRLLVSEADGSPR
jgi:hypothetical protein